MTLLMKQLILLTKVRGQWLAGVPIPGEEELLHVIA
jgi:hypothetical protein